MDNPINHYWMARLQDLKEVLEANHFEVFVAETKENAKEIVLQEILPKVGAKSVSWGGSMTFVSSGLYNAFNTTGTCNLPCQLQYLLNH